MKYKHVKQHDITDCAAACLAMVCLYYKRETTITGLRDMMGTDLKGTNLIGLSKCAEKLGFGSEHCHTICKGTDLTANSMIRKKFSGETSKLPINMISGVIFLSGSNINMKERNKHECNKKMHIEA